MWIVKLALRRPYTFAVMAIAILIAGFASFRQTPKDIFPEIDIPVISVIWTYNGLSVEEFERQITVYSEFALSANVNDVERIESQTLNGVGIIGGGNSRSHAPHRDRYQCHTPRFERATRVAR